MQEWLQQAKWKGNIQPKSNISLDYSITFWVNFIWDFLVLNFVWNPKFRGTKETKFDLNWSCQTEVKQENFGAKTTRPMTNSPMDSLLARRKREKV